MQPSSHQAVIDAIINEVSHAVVGKTTQVRLAMAAFLAGGHVLLEDIPGVGKTTLSKAMANALGLAYKRIQFTSDLLPSDILGVSYFDSSRNGFVFQEGSVFTQFLLADEINRATPKTQSALLEAMEEHQVSTEGVTRSLPEPFFVMATQNPFEEAGTFPLPDSQLDRFALSLSLGYPDAATERAILRGDHTPARSIAPVCSIEQLVQMREAVRGIGLSEAILDYAQRISTFTRESALFVRGLSTRGALALITAAKAWALMNGRAFVIPEDVQSVLGGVIGHRLLMASGERLGADKMAERILEVVAVDE